MLMRVFKIGLKWFWVWDSKKVSGIFMNSSSMVVIVVN